MITEQNYHNIKNNQKYCSVSQFKDFYGCAGMDGCEAKAMAKITGEWKEEPSIDMLIGTYVDAHFFGGEKPKLTKANTEKADKVIARIERDKFFMETLSGEPQKIITAEFFGLDWKCKIDSYHPGKCIVDLKIMSSITALSWNKTFTKKINFIEAFGYDIQGAIYQKTEGNNLPFLISAGTKEKEPDIQVFQLRQKILTYALEYVESMAERLKKVKSGKVEPLRCERCNYCKNTKALNKPVLY